MCSTAAKVLSAFHQSEVRFEMLGHSCTDNSGQTAVIYSSHEIICLPAVWPPQKLTM